MAWVHGRRFYLTFAAWRACQKQGRRGQPDFTAEHAEDAEKTYLGFLCEFCVLRGEFKPLELWYRFLRHLRRNGAGEILRGDGAEQFAQLVSLDHFLDEEAFGER